MLDWVPVSVRLPGQLGAAYLVVAGGTGVVYHAMCDQYGRWSRLPDMDDVIEVTHWAEFALPAAGPPPPPPSAGSEWAAMTDPFLMAGRLPRAPVGGKSHRILPAGYARRVRLLAAGLLRLGPVRAPEVFANRLRVVADHLDRDPFDERGFDDWWATHDPDAASRNREWREAVRAYLNSRGATGIAAACRWLMREQPRVRSARFARDTHWPDGAAIVRCVFPLPEDPPRRWILPAWRTETVTDLARQMWGTRDFDATPILADALQDAGCDHADALAHLRGPGPHCRGCWVLDAILNTGA